MHNFHSCKCELTCVFVFCILLNNYNRLAVILFKTLIPDRTTCVSWPGKWVPFWSKRSFCPVWISFSDWKKKTWPTACLSERQAFDLLSCAMSLILKVYQKCYFLPFAPTFLLISLELIKIQNSIIYETKNQF